MFCSSWSLSFSFGPFDVHELADFFGLTQKNAVRNADVRFGWDTRSFGLDTRSSSYSFRLCVYSNCGHTWHLFFYFERAPCGHFRAPEWRNREAFLQMQIQVTPQISMTRGPRECNWLCRGFLFPLSITATVANHECLCAWIWKRAVTACKC